MGAPVYDWSWTSGLDYVRQRRNVLTPRYEDLTPVLGPVVITPSVVAYGEKRCDVACTITKEKHHEP